MRRDDQINQALQMYVLLLRNKQLFTRGIAHTNTKNQVQYAFACTCLCDVIQSVREVLL
jgi:hypothetical protein